MRRTQRDRRNWSLLIFIVPLGIFLMLIVGQLALQMIPQWVLNVSMGSNLDYETENGDHPVLSPLFNSQILTPPFWQGTYLTPNPASGWFFPPFIVIQPISTTPISTSPPAVTGTVKAPTASSPPSTPTKNIPLPPPVISTRQPTNEPDITSAPPASNTPTATNTPMNTPTNTATAVPTGFPSTPDPSWTGPVSSAIVIGNPDGIIISIPKGSYTVIDINASPIIIVGSSESTYDLVYNEAEYNGPGASGEIQLDNVILGISMFADGQIYYEIFNWGNGIVDFNTNVSGVIELDNQNIPMANLWNYPGTGILIDADNAPSQPPPQTYGYLVIIGPVPAADTIQVDSILIFP